MTVEVSPAPARVDPDAGPGVRVLRLARRGRVATSRGMVPAVRVRPGDWLLLQGRRRVSVLWVAIREAVCVFLGQKVLRPGGPHLTGRVSPLTGRFERVLPATGPGRRAALH